MLRKILKKLVDWIIPIVLGILIAALWQSWQHSRPRLPFRLEDMDAVVALPAGGELHRYKIEFWHDEATPISNLTFRFTGVAPGFAARVHLEGQEFAASSPAGGTTNVLQLLPTLQPQRKITLEIDTSTPIEPSNIFLSSDQIIGGRYLPWWRFLIVEDALRAVLSFIIYGALFYFIVSQLSGAKVFGKIREHLAEVSSIIEKEKELGSQLVAEREKLEKLEQEVRQDSQRIAEHEQRRKEPGA